MTENNGMLNKIKRAITHGDVDYFEMFIKGSNISLKAALALQSAFADEIVSIEELTKIKEIEHEGDRLVHESLKVLEEAFITPIDQTDLMEILKGIENITDSIDYVATHCYMLKIEHSDNYIDSFITIMISACEELVELMQELRNFKKTPFKRMNQLIVDINAKEEAADRIYTESMRNLFTNETNPITIIRKKEIYQRLEDVLDRLEDVADMVERLIVAKL